MDRKPFNEHALIPEAVAHEDELTKACSSTASWATIRAICKTMEWRDPYTAGHQKRVGSIALAIGRQLGWDEERLEGLYMAAIVHDIGKMAVPYEILIKPTQLSESDMQMIRIHAEAGYQILKDIPFPRPIAEMVYQHHERLDGSGYPRGLKGEQVCEEARVLAVADTIDAMATNRPYRTAPGLNAALDEIRTQSGIKLDAKIVDAVSRLLEDGNELQEIIDYQ